MPERTEDNLAATSELDTKVLELQALYELSRQLTSSVNLKEILDTILLTPMGKMLLGKGLVLVTDDASGYAIKTLKGLPKSLLGHRIQVEDFPSGPEFLEKLPPAPWREFLLSNGIELVIPITHAGRRLGMIGFGKKIVGKGFTDSDLEYLNSLSNMAAAAVQNGLYVEELDQQRRLLEKQKRDLNTLFEISEELKTTSAIEEALNLLAFSIMGEMVVNRCLIFMKSNGGLTLKVSKGLRGASELDALNDDEMLDELTRLKKPLNLRNSSVAKLSDTLTRAGIAVLIPMRVQNETHGVIALGEKINQAEFTQDELEFLTTLGNSAMNYVESLEKQRLEEELQIASDIQRKLLPSSCPTTERFEVAAINVPSRQVGGDYYDCIQLDDRRYAFCIADVSGKGAPAALLMSNLQASLHVLLDTGLAIDQITSRINNLIHKNTGYDKFITYFLGVLDAEAGTFTYVNAGHNPPYLFHKDRSFQTLTEGGLILGMMPDAPYATETVNLEPGDCLVLFTDGVSEAMNAEEEEFEEKRIEACVQENYALDARGILEALRRAVEEFSEGQPQADDITILVLKML